MEVVIIINHTEEDIIHLDKFKVNIIVISILRGLTVLHLSSIIKTFIATLKIQYHMIGIIFSLKMSIILIRIQITLCQTRIITTIIVLMAQATEIIIVRSNQDMLMEAIMDFSRTKMHIECLMSNRAFILSSSSIIIIIIIKSSNLITHSHKASRL